MSFSSEQVASLVQQWGLDATDFDYPAAGTMNDIAVVTTRAGKVVLRGHRRRERHRVAFEHAVMAHASSHGIPVPAAITTPEGRLCVEQVGRFYSLFEHAAGQQVARNELNNTLAQAMGRSLGQLHTVLREFRPPNTPRAHREHDPQAAIHRIEELLACIAVSGQRGEQDAWAIERLQTRAAWLRRHPDLPRVDVESEQVTHGDYQDTNLFFDQGTVSSIIDWDKAELRPPGEEVVRTMHLSLLLDPAWCRAFLGGYRSVTDLSDEQLHRSAVTYNSQRACDLWLYETVYLLGDDRPRRFITPGRFVPFLEQWKPVQALLCSND